MKCNIIKYVEIFGLFDSPGNSMRFTLTIQYDSLERSKHRSVLAIFIDEDTLMHLILIRSVYADKTELAAISELRKTVLDRSFLKTTVQSQ